MSGLWELDATAQAEVVRSGEVSPPELVQAAIDRIERWNDLLNAVVTPLFEQALERATKRLPSGPFTGVPLLLKDYLCETAGDPYYEGSRFLRCLGWRSPADSHLARRFRNAGFVVLGKTNLPEFAASPTTEPAAFGATRSSSRTSGARISSSGWPHSWRKRVRGRIAGRIVGFSG